MQVLLSSIGSRGDVQPILALALELQALGHQARLCVAPNFKEWIKSYGLEYIPIGPDLKKLTGGTVPGKPVLPPPEQLQQDGRTNRCARNSRSSAKRHVAAISSSPPARCRSQRGRSQRCRKSLTSLRPTARPSCHRLNTPRRKRVDTIRIRCRRAKTCSFGNKMRQEFNRFGATLNEERSESRPGSRCECAAHTCLRIVRGSPPIRSIAPAFPLAGMEVVQTGAWILSDQTALPDDLENFLAGGAPPIYLGFGSMRASEQTGRVLIEAARALGLRSILSQGWANLTPSDTGNDCLSIGDVNHEKLFPRVAAIVHHGGAGTTTSAIRAGRAQVIIPHNYDQFYWAHRVQQLGVGVSGPMRDDLTVDALVQALRECLRPEVTARAQALAGRIELHGARIAAERLVHEFA